MLVSAEEATSNSTPLIICRVISLPTGIYRIFDTSAYACNELAYAEALVAVNLHIVFRYLRNLATVALKCQPQPSLACGPEYAVNPHLSLANLLDISFNSSAIVWASFHSFCYSQGPVLVVVMSSDYAESDKAPAKAGTIPALWSAKNIPHSADFPDPYELIGDAYERISVADQWEIQDP